MSLIINAFVNDGSIFITKDIETPGFYLIDGKITPFQIKEIKDFTREELRESGLFLTELVRRHRRTKIPATTIKWGVVAPFNYALKQYTEDLCWMPWIGSSGYPRSGKTTQGRIVNYTWIDFYPKNMQYQLAYTGANTQARMAAKLKKSTFPLTINECHELAEDSSAPMREMVKVSMETRVSRGTYQDKTHWIEEPALCPCILTSNPPFSDELGFRSRLIYNVYTKEDKFWDANQKKEFMAFLTQAASI